MDPLNSYLKKCVEFYTAQLKKGQPLIEGMVDLQNHVNNIVLTPNDIINNSGSDIEKLIIDYYRKQRGLD
jgi:hypothetical protein